jgi:hypothetical protein
VSAAFLGHGANDPLGQGHLGGQVEREESELVVEVGVQEGAAQTATRVQRSDTQR